MEDASICQLLPLPGHALFCVFDGHGGREASQFGKDSLVEILAATSDWQRYFLLAKQYRTPTNKQLQDMTKLLQSAMTLTFVELDRELYLHHYGDKALVKSSPGSTAVAVLLTPFTMVCANLGDSRAILARSSASSPTSVVPHPLSYDQTPGLETEKQRILKAGGVVVDGRVDGELAVSRAFGDFEFKELSSLMTDDYNASEPDDVCQLLERAQQNKVSAYPEVLVHNREDTNDRFVVLACDGVWDVASNENVVEWVTDMFQQRQNDIGKICELLLDICLGKQSQDNMTVLLVLLPGGRTLMKQKIDGCNRKSSRSKQSKHTSFHGMS